MRSSLSYLYQILGKNRSRIVLLSVIVSIYSLSGLVYALLFRNLADQAIRGSFSDIRRDSLVFVCVLLLQNVLNAFIHRLQEKTSVDIENRLKKIILSDIFLRDYTEVSNVHSGEWINKITNDIAIVARNAVQLLPNFCSIVVHILASVIVLTGFLPKLMVLLLFVVCIALVFEFFFYRYIKLLHNRVQEEDGLLRIFLQEHIKSLVVIKSYSKEESSIDDFERNLNKYKDARLKKNLFSVIMNFFFGTGINGALIISSIYCAYEIINQRISYGTFVAVIQIVSQIRGPIAGAYVNIPNFYSMIGSIERLAESEKYPEDKTDSVTDMNEFYKDSFGNIDLSGVSFEYRDENNRKQVIEGLSFVIRKGAFIGISGPSGCGKSTLFKLLLSLYHPISGNISIVTKGERIELSNHFRKLFAYVPQDNMLMKGKIKDIICFGENYDENRMIDSLKISCCEEFIDKLPEGIDSELKEGGSGLSEGQMQRIAIARAVYSGHPILLLDEVTSALNEELEIQILKNLKEMTNRTVLLITHHKKALDYADIVVDCSEEEDRYIWSIRKKK